MAIDQGALAVSLAECKAYLRLDRDDEDGVLAGLLRTAAGLCETFIGQWLIIREAEQRLNLTEQWQRLLVLPAVSLVDVTDGALVLTGDRFAFEVGNDGLGWLRLTATEGLAAPVIRYRAGLAADWNDVPEALRHGIVRLAVHLYTHRDAADAGPPPAAVAALWRPWRRLSLG